MRVGRREFLAGVSAPLILGASGVTSARTLLQGREPILAQTLSGPVIGQLDQGALAFKCIPYGASTSGRSRFMPPSPPQPWDKPVHAFSYGPAAPQSDPTKGADPGGGKEAESEDCLTLNVWTPALDDNGKRPVMVWLHGGGLWRLSAAGDYQAGARLAANNDVVMVSPNHRLNVLGHAYLDEFDPLFEGSSSAGILDLVLALQWVRDNIEAFGGDPDNVTIFGQSGGGQKVSLLMAMPAAHGLFHKAIIQSGPAPLALERPYARELTARLLTLLEIPPSRVRDIQTVPLDAIMRAYYRIFDEIGGFGVLGIIQDFAPVVDGGVLPQHPFWHGASPLSRDVPLMIGCTRTEMSEYFLTTHPDAHIRDFREVTDQLEPIFGADAAAIVAHYRAAHPAASSWEVDALIRSDWPTRLFTQKIADEHAKLGAPTWVYRMDWETTARNGLLMSPHAIDIPFVLDTVGTEPVEPGELGEQQAMMRQMSSAWVSFARRGNPQSDSIPEWQPYNRVSRPTLLLNTQSRMVNDPDGSDISRLKIGLPKYRVVGGGVATPAI
jgi:para-nitrobenzyl esterase